MTAGSGRDEPADLPEAHWNDSSVAISSLLPGTLPQLPCIARVSNAELGDFGGGNGPPDRRQLQYTVRRTEKILASNVYWNECDEHFVAVGPKVIIPVDNPGTFGSLFE